MDITAISDLHGFYPELPGGDLLIVAGDLTARDTLDEYTLFIEWLEKQKYSKKILIAGNHDNEIEKGIDFYFPELGIDYLCDSGTEFEGLKIWGSPWCLKFNGMNPRCMAFTCDTEQELNEKWKLIPDDTDILITHSPPHGILDKTARNENVGSKTLRGQMGRITPSLWVCGHIHEGYGKFQDTKLSGIDYLFLNASHVNEYYEPVNKPMRIIL